MRLHQEEVPIMKKKEIHVGLVFFASAMILQRFFALPDFVLGIMIGISLFCFVLALLPKEVYEAIKNKKSNILQKITKS